jgi:hypothetical protein
MKSILPIILFLIGINAIAQVPNANNRARISGDTGDMLTIEEGTGTDKDYNAGYYQQDGKYGFVYPENVRQKTIYDIIQFASNNFIIKKDGLYGIADRKGVIIGKIEFDSIGSISQSNVFIVKKKGKYGSITPDGKPILSVKYDKVLYTGTQNPVSFVENKDGNVSLIFNKDEKKFPQKIDYAEVYANLTILKVNGKFGIIKDQTIIPFEYDSIYVPVAEGYNNFNKSKKVKKINPFAFEYSKLSKTVSLMTIQKAGKVGLADLNATIIYPADNDAVNSVEMKRYYTVKKNNLYGIYFMDSGKKTEIEFDRVYADGTGYVMADKNRKGGAFNMKGEQIIPFEYDPEFIAQYRFGLKITKDKKKGFTDKTGKVIIPPLYDDVDSFYESGMDHFIKVKLGEKVGVINLKNETIIPVNFEWIGEENGFFKVVTPEPNRKFGLYSKTGKLIVPAEYNGIRNSETQDSKITVLRKDDNSYNFLNQKSEFIFPQNISGYDYVLDQEKLLNPLDVRGKSLLFVKGKNGKCGLLNEITEVLDVPMVYDQIIQRFQSEKNIYYSVKKGKKYGLINAKNQEIIPFQYDFIDVSLIQSNYNDLSDISYSVIVKKEKKFGTVSLKNQVQIPFVYDDLQRISENGLFKAKKGKEYQIINSKNEVINKGPFDQVANFEQQDGRGTALKALTFYNNKMKVVNEKGKFLSTEIAMTPHEGYVTFDDLKQALIKALDSPDETLLKDFANKIAPSDHLLYFFKENLFNKTSLEFTDIKYIKEKYYNDLLEFKNSRWNNKSGFGYNHSSLTDFADYTWEKEGYVTNVRTRDHAFGDTRFMEKVLRNAIKVNGFWISTYFMTRSFENR